MADNASNGVISASRVAQDADMILNNDVSGLAMKLTSERIHHNNRSASNHSNGGHVTPPSSHSSNDISSARNIIQSNEAAINSYSSQVSEDANNHNVMSDVQALLDIQGDADTISSAIQVASNDQLDPNKSAVINANAELASASVANYDASRAVSSAMVKIPSAVPQSSSNHDTPSSNSINSSGSVSPTSLNSSSSSSSSDNSVFMSSGSSGKDSTASSSSNNRMPSSGNIPDAPSSTRPDSINSSGSSIDPSSGVNSDGNNVTSNSASTSTDSGVDNEAPNDTPSGASELSSDSGNSSDEPASDSAPGSGVSSVNQSSDSFRGASGAIEPGSNSKSSTTRNDDYQSDNSSLTGNNQDSRQGVGSSNHELPKTGEPNGKSLLLALIIISGELSMAGLEYDLDKKRRYSR